MTKRETNYTIAQISELSDLIFAHIGRIFVFSTIIIVWLFVLYNVLFLNRIVPGVVVATIPVGGKTRNQVYTTISQISPPKTIRFVASDKEIQLDTTKLNLNYNYDQTAASAFSVGRTGNLLERLNDQWTSITRGTSLPISANYNQDALDSALADISDAFAIPSIEPGVRIENHEVIVESGKTGQDVDRNVLLARTQEALIYGKNSVVVPLNATTQALTPEQTKSISARANTFISAKLTISLEDTTVQFTDSYLVGLLAPNSGYKPDKIQSVIDQVAQKINRPVQEAALQFENNRVVEFKPAKDGITLDQQKFKEHLVSALAQIESGQKEYTIHPPVIHNSPTITTDKVNNLGIKELIGKGTSQFRGSIPSRIHNIELASSRLNGILIPPGETFSFNQAVGEVSNLTGYQQAYIIKGGKTILGDGGGVCQVSTTMFRAALNAGLPILERTAHAYRVSYYELDTGPGFDATVYQPSPDFKFKNDTANYILIQTSFDKANLKLLFELYGTSDGRISEVSKSHTWDVTPPPDDLYQDDPTLPAGTVKQIEHRANGAKVSFDYKVTRNGEILQNRTFYSVYHPWQAVYLRSTAQ